MDFLSLKFIVFTAISLLVFWLILKDNRTRRFFLLIVSLIFIASHSYVLLGVLLALTWINYNLLIKITSASDSKELYLTVVALLNIILILSVKFYPWPLSPLLTTIGLSFYFFRIFSLALDAYYERLESNLEFLSFLNYLSFFPVVLAGPLMNYDEFIESLKGHKERISEGLLSSCFLFLRGAAKKVLISQVLGNVVQSYSYKSEESSITEFIFYGFLNVIYITSDLSAYSDMARGLAGLFGVEVPSNFHFSLFAKNISDFWKRQHITLSNWFRNYVFMPSLFLFNKAFSVQISVGIALMVTLILSGLWHSFSINGVIFGLLNFICFVVLLKIKPNKFLQCFNFLFMWMTLIITFWLILFPLKTIPAQFNNMISFENLDLIILLTLGARVVGFFILDYINEFMEKKRDRNLTIGSTFFHAVLFILILIFLEEKSAAFIYFNF